ncbi:hypothetical protein A2765_01785 [Candidatus Kaiserbacteria bacterium RIFCSPHIGHO2_01_FULL_56_24]|uniref:Methyltransferase domain-containing protein n=1 Tax=Candidatus Kaiserbacteria bacterium RIFCSPHIGHO2_01_FULL_56_24 TaxID=1798487 RepID=A0A1F6DH80_9BACT|nr:MAG: hypothetical protein A2765_01785 [Candidatus Kaiserbacteria bacterium RIFCSPHIGHO2_01_FULL_56_24]
MHPDRSGVSHGTYGFAHPARNVDALGIEPGMKIADFGAGSGAYVLAIAKALLGSGTVYALDIQKDLLRRIKNEADAKGFKNVEILWGDLEVEGGSKLADDMLDIVLISNLLFQVKDTRALITEARRILRPHGKLAIVDWSESFGGLGPIKEDVVPKEDAYELARTAGLLFVKEFPAGAHHYGLVFRKTKESASGR